MKKFLFISLIILTLVSVFSVCCFAASDEVAEDVYAGEQADVEEENFFEIIYEEFLKHSDKLLSALAFVASLLVVFAYKKGLIPIIKASLSALGATVSSLKNESEKVSAEAGAAILSATEKLSAAEDVINALGKRLESIEQQLNLANENQLKGESVYTVISAQIDMLYEVFMSSSLPAYQKDSVGERIAEMKKSLASYDKAVSETNE